MPVTFSMRLSTGLHADPEVDITMSKVTIPVRASRTDRVLPPLVLEPN